MDHQTRFLELITLRQDGAPSWSPELMPLRPHFLQSVGSHVRTTVGAAVVGGMESREEDRTMKLGIEFGGYFSHDGSGLPGVAHIPAQDISIVNLTYILFSFFFQLKIEDQVAHRTRT